MSADAFIQFRVTPEVKTLLRALAAREQISESALVRQLVETMLRMQVKAGMPAFAQVEKESRDARVYVRLEEAVRVALMKRALERGMPSWPASTINLGCDGHFFRVFASTDGLPARSLTLSAPVLSFCSSPR